MGIIGFNVKCLFEYRVFYLIFSRCYSSVGFFGGTSGYQELSLGSNCISRGTALHEIGHYLGFKNFFLFNSF